MVEGAGFPDRATSVLFNASLGSRTRNLTYRGGTGVSDQVASRDLRLLVDAGYLEAHGEWRGRVYVRTGRLAEVDARIRARRSQGAGDDPFVLAAAALEQPRLWTARALGS